MFNQISWASYFETVVYSLAIYYIFFLFKYYRDDLLNMLNTKRKYLATQAAYTSDATNPTDSSDKIINPVDQTSNEDRNNGLSSEAQTLTDEIHAFTTEARVNEFEREPILLSLQLIVNRFPSVKSSPYRKTIQQVIAQLCASNCSVHLSEEELEGLWL